MVDISNNLVDIWVFWWSIFDKTPVAALFMDERPVQNTAAQGFPATSIHGDRLQSEREQVVDLLTG